MEQFVCSRFLRRNAGHLMCFAFAPLAFVASGVLSGSHAGTENPAHSPSRLPLATSDVAFAEGKRRADAGAVARVVHGRNVGQLNVDASFDDGRHVWEDVAQAVTPDRVDHGVDIVGGMMLSQVDQVEGSVEGVFDNEPTKAEQKKLKAKVTSKKHPTAKLQQLKGKKNTGKERAGAGAAKKILKHAMEKKMAADFKAESALGKLESKIKLTESMVKRELAETKENLLEKRRKKSATAALKRRLSAQQKKFEAEVQRAKSMVKNAKTHKEKLAAKKMLRKATEKKMAAGLNAEVALKELKANLKAKGGDQTIKMVGMHLGQIHANKKSKKQRKAVDQTAKSSGQKDKSPDAGVAAKNVKKKATKTVAEVPSKKPETSAKTKIEAEKKLITAAKQLCKYTKEKHAAKNKPNKKGKQVKTTTTTTTTTTSSKPRAVAKAMAKVAAAKKILQKVHSPIGKALAKIELKKAKAKEKKAEKDAKEATTTSTPPPKVAKKIAKADIKDAKHMLKCAKTPEGKKVAKRMLLKAAMAKTKLDGEAKVKKLGKALKAAETPIEKAIVKAKIKKTIAVTKAKCAKFATTTTSTMLPCKTTTTTTLIPTTTTTLGPVEIARKKILKKDEKAVKEARKMLKAAATPVAKKIAEKILEAAEAKEVEAAVSKLPCTLPAAPKSKRPKIRPGSPMNAVNRKMLPKSIATLVKKVAVTTTSAPNCNCPSETSAIDRLSDAQTESAAATKAIEHANTQKKRKAALSDLRKATAEKKAALREVQQTVGDKEKKAMLEATNKEQDESRKIKGKGKGKT
eukprot:TRINITY_DN43105_c0_g1_i1.p1 TRINITY_DN43105_c0_g1~~TRINITY_DN43105_c0_g1_i1.p1  ORF type:complete len:799 (+),score=196.37 TRINITY_DN43105_c0_g1_i1:138-2534(+)